MMKRMFLVRRVICSFVLSPSKDEPCIQPCFDKLSTRAGALLGAAQRSRPVAARLELPAIDSAGKLRRAARGQDAGLLHPVLALDAALEVQGLADAGDIRR